MQIERENIMFITKKALNEKIAKALEEREKEIWLDRRIDRLADELNRRIDRLGEAVYKLKRMHEVSDAEPEMECVPLKVGY